MRTSEMREDKAARRVASSNGVEGIVEGVMRRVVLSGRVLKDLLVLCLLDGAKFACTPSLDLENSWIEGMAPT